MKLQIKDLSVAYDTGVVLRGVDLQVAEGEFVSLLGPSGCGKTTLMKAIAGILPVKGGSVAIDGSDITALAVHKRGTVIMFQDMRLFPHLTVVENVAFPMKMQGVDKAARLQLAEEYLEKVQMAGFGRRRPSELSGGQQQRVALARALAARPRLLLLDEPFSALDENLREDMRWLVLELKREFGMTAILVTHDREEALSMSDRVVLMFDGRIAQQGTPRQVYTHPASRRVADYFGDCVYISGRVEGGVFTGGGLTAQADAADGAYDMLLRPGDFRPEEGGSYTARVEEVRFRGSDTLVSFRGEDGTVWKKSFSQTPPWQPGEGVNAHIALENAVFFPLEERE